MAMNKVLTSDRSMPTPAWTRVLASCLVVVAGLVPIGLAEGQASVLPEVQVTTAAIPDYEFDSARDGTYCPTCNGGDGNSRLVFSDGSNNLWVGHVDFQTGDFVPADGHGVLIASNATAPTDYGNGPGMAVLGGRLPVRLHPVPGALRAAQGRRRPRSAWRPRSAASGRWPPCPTALGRASPAATLDVERPRSAHQLRHRRQERRGITARARRSASRSSCPLSSLIERQLPPLGPGHAQDHVPGPRPQRSAAPARPDVHLRHRQRRARAAHLQSRRAWSAA